LTIIGPVRFVSGTRARFASEEETAPLLAALREERKALEEEIAALTAPAKVVTLHPGMVKRYLEVVDDLATSLVRRNAPVTRGLPRQFGNWWPRSPLHRWQSDAR